LPLINQLNTLTGSSSCLPVIGLWMQGGAGLLDGSFGFGGGFTPECALCDRKYIIHP